MAFRPFNTMQFPAHPASPAAAASAERAGLTTRMRTAIVFGLLALAVFALVGWGSGHWAHQQVMNDAGRGLQRLAQRMSSTLDAGMFERYREIRNLAGIGLARDPSADASAWRQAVERLQQTLRHYAWIGVADPSGRVIAATDGQLEGQDVSERPWFVQGRGRPFASEVHDAAQPPEPLQQMHDGEPVRMVDLSAPIGDGKRLAGVLGAHLNWSWAHEIERELLEPVEAKREVEVLVINRSGVTLLGPTPAPGRLDAALVGSLVDEGHRVLAWGDGRRYLTAASRTGTRADTLDLGWTVLVRQPVETAVAAATQLRWRIWGIGLAGALVFGMAGWWLAGWLTAPLERVARRAEAWAAGAPGSDEAPGANAPHEVAQLSQSLGVLVMRLRHRERELMALTATLEARVAERTEALEQANSDLRSFSRTVSHDLKGPINSIGAAVRLVTERAGLQLDPRSRQMLALVSTECERLVRLVDELLLLARVEQQTLHLQPVDMQALVDEMLAHLGPATADGHPPAPQPSFDIGALPAAQGDALLLRQVWQNLLNNAVKFSRHTPQPCIAVRAEALEHEIVYSVRDNGTGFDMRQADRLFGVFQRLHSAADYPGTGIGLSIVKRVIARHGGRVWAEGHQGEGACFYFALPKAQPRDESAARSLEGSWPEPAQAENNP